MFKTPSSENQKFTSDYELWTYQDQLLRKWLSRPYLLKYLLLYLFEMSLSPHGRDRILHAFLGRGIQFIFFRIFPFVLYLGLLLLDVYQAASPYCGIEGSYEVLPQDLEAYLPLPTTTKQWLFSSSSSSIWSTNIIRLLLLLMFIDVLIDSCRGGSIKGALYRHVIDYISIILAIVGWFLLVFQIESPWFPIRPQLLMLLPIFRLTHITVSIFVTFRSRFFIPYSIVKHLQAITFVVALSCFLLVIGTENSIFEKSRSNSDGGDFLKILYQLLLGFVAGEEEKDIGDAVSIKIILLSTIIVGGFVFALTTDFIPRFLGALVKHIPADRWRLEYLKNHIIICGNNKTVPHLVSDLAVTPGFKHKNYVFITKDQHPNYFSKLPLPSEQLYYVAGDYTDANILRKAGAVEARHAIIVADDDKNTIEDRDTRAVFAAFNIEHIGQENKEEIITIVERLTNRHSDTLAQQDVEAAINRSELTGKALALACQYPKLLFVLTDLLSYRYSCSLRLEPLKPHWGGTEDVGALRDYLYKRKRLLLGSVPFVPRGSPLKNEEPVELSVNPKLAENKSAVIIYENTKKNWIPNNSAISSKIEFRDRATINKDKGKVVILGWSEACFYLISELVAVTKDKSEFVAQEVVIITDDIEPKTVAKKLQDQFSKDYSTKKALSHLYQLDITDESEAEISSILTSYNKENTTTDDTRDQKGINIHYKKLDFREMVWNEGDLREASLIVVVAERTETTKDRDARNVFTTLAIYHAFKNESERPHVVVELMDPANAAIFDKKDVEVVLRNELSGGALATACRHPKLVEIPLDLLTTRQGNRLKFVEVSERKALEQNLKNSIEKQKNFQTIADFYLKHNMLVIGYDQPEEPNWYIRAFNWIRKTMGYKKLNQRQWTAFDPKANIPDDVALIAISVPPKLNSPT